MREIVMGNVAPLHKKIEDLFIEGMSLKLENEKLKQENQVLKGIMQELRKGIHL